MARTESAACPGHKATRAHEDQLASMARMDLGVCLVRAAIQGLWVRRGPKATQGRGVHAVRKEKTARMD